MELYITHFGNQSYVVKVMGVPVLRDDYILGYVFLIVFLLLLMGPIYFFSEFSQFSVLNPVSSAEISIAIQMAKKLSIADLVNRTVPVPKAEPIADPITDIDPLDTSSQASAAW